MERTCEHALKFVCVLEAASLFQLRNHARLRFVRSRNAVDETFRELGRVILLENILVLQIFEQDHLSVQFRINS